MTALALETEHRIDHMFEHAWPGDAAILGHMADHHQRRALLLGEADQLLCTRPHLTDGARRALDEVAVHRLDRIDDEKIRRIAMADGGEDIPHRSRARQLNRRIAKTQTARAQAHLIGGFLAADIGH